MNKCYSDTIIVFINIFLLLYFPFSYYLKFYSFYSFFSFLVVFF